MKEYLLKLPKELHTQIKIMSVLQGKTMMEFMIEAIKEKIEREQNKA